MKKTLFYSILAIAAGTASTYFMAWGNLVTRADSYTKLPQDKVDMVREVAKQFRDEQNRYWQCYFDNKEVSLTAIMLAKVANESSYGTKWMGAKYNNRGNIHWDLIWKQIGTVCGDSTCKYPKYATAEDGLKNLAMWLKNKWCTMTFETSFAYVKWPKAPITKSNIAQIQKYHNRMASVIRAYDENRDLFLVETTETINEGRELNGLAPINTTTTTQDKAIKTKPNKACYFVRKIRKADYVQIDEGGQMLTQVDIGKENGKYVDVFNCYWEK